MTDTHYDVTGPDGAPVLVLGPSLGSTMSLWDAQLPTLARQFRVVRFDYRGHGGTPTPGPGPYVIDDLARDVVDLLDRLGVERFSYAGVSIGGMVGMWLGANAADRVDRLVLCCTTANYADPKPWIERAAQVRREGTGSVADAVVSRWFTPEYARANAELVDRFKAGLSAVDDEAYAGCCEALSTMDLRPALPRITAPTMVIAATGDLAAPPAVVAEVAAAIPRVRRRIVEDAAHLAVVQQPAAVAGLLMEHLR
jgi:3-oxoadipate enol-lactonase